MSQTPTDSGIRRLADLPSPQGLPVLGNLLQLSSERLHLTLEQCGDDREASLAHDARAYLQFGAGTRVGLRRQLAGIEIRLVLSMLCRNFTMELATERESIKEVLAFTMMPSAMPVRLRSRR
jgi:hypothetical protein